MLVTDVIRPCSDKRNIVGKRYHSYPPAMTILYCALVQITRNMRGGGGAASIAEDKDGATLLKCLQNCGDGPVNGGIGKPWNHLRQCLEIILNRKCVHVPL